VGLYKNRNAEIRISTVLGSTFFSCSRNTGDVALVRGLAVRASNGNVRKLLDRAQIGADRGWGVIAALKFVEHALTKWGHWDPLL
jgi:hypothetical protein